MLKFVEYSEKSLVLFGDDLDKYKAYLNTTKGVYNPYLKQKEGFEGGKGWIFSKKHTEMIENFIESVKNNTFVFQETETKKDESKQKGNEEREEKRTNVVKNNTEEENTRVSQEEFRKLYNKLESLEFKLDKILAMQKYKRSNGRNKRSVSDNEEGDNEGEEEDYTMNLAPTLIKAVSSTRKSLLRPSIKNEE